MSDETPQKKTRTYHSPRRQEQAIVTRDRIVAAALGQLQEKGYADMTLESIARDAGVAPQTVYAVCGSKKGVLAAILENSVEAQKYDRERDLIMEVKTGEERVQAMGHFLSLLLESSGPAFQLMRGLGVLSPELADVELDYEMMIYEKNMKQVQQMASDGLLRSGLDVESATDMLWAVSAPGVHRRLIQLRGWTAERYEEFMTRLFACLLLNPEAASRMSQRDVSSFSENEPWQKGQDAEAPAGQGVVSPEEGGEAGAVAPQAMRRIRRKTVASFRSPNKKRSYLSKV